MNQQTKYPEYKSLNLAEIDRQILSFWKENKIFEKSISSREGQKPFVFYEGPPSANGRPGIHHVISRTIKDLFCRYKTLRNFQVKRKGGWDTHGLPVELSVEKMLGLKKDDIGKKISIEEYNSICKKEVMKFKSVWDDLTEKMGYWVDLDHPYITFENSYIETLWWLLKQFYEKGYLYEGFTVQPYSPAAGTGLSTHELNQPGTYKIIKDTSVIAMFRLVRNEKSESLFKNADADIYFLAWTTTPWTLPSNCALAVGENISYCLVRTFNPYTLKPVIVVLAKDLLHKYFPEKNAELAFEDFKPGDRDIPYKIFDELTGKDLEWMNYEQLLPYVQPHGLSFVVITGDFVTTEEGTGIVHTASLFGADDFRVCKAKGIASVLVKDENGNDLPLVDKQGKFVKEVTDFAGEYVKEQYLTDEEKEADRKKQGGNKYLNVDERIAIKLKQEGKAFKVEKFEHSYPHCWRTDKPVLYYPLDAWFIKTTAARDRLVELNKTINWKPESTGTGRFGNWLENVQDWNLSRSRFWGTPLPIWKTDDGSEEKCIGSIQELKEEIEKALQAGVEESNSKLVAEILKNEAIDLHRPFVDEIILVSNSGKHMHRVPDLIDVWFDSGSMPYAQWGLNEKKVEEKNSFPFAEGWDRAFPADYIAEGVDQTRGWFYTLHVIAVMLFDSVAYKNVVANGLVLDKVGNKMSKRIGNVVEPFEVIEKYGTDATRWYLMSNSQPWDNLKFDITGVDDARRKLFGTLYNTYSFFALYANIDGFVKNEKEVPLAQRSELDRWIISKLNTLIQTVTESFEDYNPTIAARAIEEFVDRNLSNWYIRLSRRRFWRGDLTEDKQAAYETLYECLNIVAQLMSPIAPFFSDWLYKNLNDNSASSKEESVHLTHWRVSNPDLIDPDLEERMELAQTISSLVLSIRKKMSIKVRQPLQKVIIPFHDEKMRRQVEKMKHIILSEVNVKELELLQDDGSIVKKKVKPNYKLLGQRLGKNMKVVAEYLTTIPVEKINELEQNQSLSFSLDGSDFVIQRTEVEIVSDDVAGWQVASDGSVTVALDVAINQSLLEEGNARELVNRIQNLRKEMDLNVTDRIDVKLLKHESLVSSVNEYKKYICAEILADSFQMVDSLDDGKTIEVNELPLKIIIKPK